nr:unnamed protein product [Haemonchus contortus]
MFRTALKVCTGKDERKESLELARDIRNDKQIILELPVEDLVHDLVLFTSLPHKSQHSQRPDTSNVLVGGVQSLEQ